MDWDIIYSYDWNGRFVDGVYKATGLAASQSVKGDLLAISRIKGAIAKELFRCNRVILFEPNGGAQISFGAGKFQKGAPRGQLVGHASVSIDGNFVLEVYEALPLHIQSATQALAG